MNRAVGRGEGWNRLSQTVSQQLAANYKIRHGSAKSARIFKFTFCIRKILRNIIERYK